MRTHLAIEHEAVQPQAMCVSSAWKHVKFIESAPRSQTVRINEVWILAGSDDTNTNKVLED